MGHPTFIFAIEKLRLMLCLGNNYRYYKLKILELWNLN